MASASTFVSEREATQFTPALGSQHVEFGNLGIVFECSGPNFEAFQKGISSGWGEYAANEIATSAVGTEYCYGASMQWEGCLLDFHAPSGGILAGTVDIGPGHCRPTAFKYGSCEWTIPPQKGLSTTYSNSGTGTGRTIGVSIRTTHLEYTSAGGPGCGKAGTFKDGTWWASTELKGVQPGTMTPVGVRVSETPSSVALPPLFSDSLYIEGEESEKLADQPHFAAAAYPAYLYGELSEAQRFTPKVPGDPITCGSGQFDGTLSYSAQTLAINASYGSCEKFLGQEVTVAMNSCHYAFGLANTDPPYSGTMGIVCSKESDTVEIHVGTLCTYSLPAQTLGTVTYVGGLSARVEGSSVKSTKSGSIFCPGGSEKGTFSGNYIWRGER